MCALQYNEKAQQGSCQDVGPGGGQLIVVKGQALFSGSENFSWYQKFVPEAFFILGCKPTEAKEAYPTHNANYDFNDDAILIGSEIFVQIIRRPLPL